MQFEKPIVPSLLDRLLDDDPSSGVDPPKFAAQGLRELRQQVRRDLENLLNTRQRCRSFPSDLTELDHSLVNYGIPDVTGSKLGTERARDEFRRTVEEMIPKFDARFRSVRVKVLENADKLDRTLHFRIDATLSAPISETLVFDTSLEPSSGTFEVKKVT